LEKAEKLESYPLYGTMKKISAAIFEWEPSDIEVLLRLNEIRTVIKNPPRMSKKNNEIITGSTLSKKNLKDRKNNPFH
jgi:hypothetical protein